MKAQIRSYKKLFLNNYIVGIICVLCLLVLPVNARAKTITAASCSLEDVQAAINDPALEAGDTVAVPAGTSEWTAPLLLNPMPAITLQGAGIDQTTIVAGLPTGGWMQTPIWIVSSVGSPFRITGFTFSGANGKSDFLYIMGNCKDWRIDNCKFDYNKNGKQINIHGATWGVIDHCTFIMDEHSDLPGIGSTSIFIQHENWGSSDYGDGSFAEPLYLGTEKAIYVEDCTFTSVAPHAFTGAMDAQLGGRYVFRYNTVENTYILAHGNDSNARGRGTRSIEVYGNTFTHLEPGGFDYEDVIALRGGTGVIFNNTAAGNYRDFTLTKLYRAYVTTGFTFGCHHLAPYYPWRCDPHDPCDGDSIYDGNFVFDEGNHTGGPGQSILTSSGKNWADDEWAGYMVKNLGDGSRGFITGNTADTITADCCELDWDTDDQFEIFVVDEFGNPQFLTGVHEGTDDNMSLIVDFVPPEWMEYNLAGALAVNLTDKSNMIIDSLNVSGDGSYIFLKGRFDGSCGCEFSWDDGDQFQIVNGYPCLDQVGRGMDSGEGTLQAQEPLYEWNNTLNELDGDIKVQDLYPRHLKYIEEGRDFYNDVPEGLYASIPSTCEPYEAYWATDENTLYKCTATDTWEAYYTPYTYPHPLTLGGLAEDVTGDGVVNALDIQACVNHVLMVQDWGSAADVNNSGSVDAVDIQAIVNEVLRI